ncbi:gliding motility protein GldB-related protein [Spirosoma rhododendri]|uniref:Gliding motility protein n=1 Tax=Spirosoma rhododendri TaxID=2728024 RepID=A0A7L5DPH6_9BACT|nr:gliding motility protein [Spirosoma rhododendri]QJD77927.1 gliding motility protein [Spirosoma rhododendri]
MQIRVALVGLFCALWLCSCSKPDEVTVVRLDQQLFAAKSANDIRAFLNQHPGVAQLYFNANQAGNDTALVRELTDRVNNPALQDFNKQLQTEYGDLADLRTQLADAFANIKKDFPNFKAPRVETIATGFMGPDLVVNDSLVVIGIDYFAGPKSKYRPVGPSFPQYILRRYQRKYIVPAVIFAISDRYNATNRTDQTLLADMVYYGKGYVFTRTMLPNTNDSLIIGYSDKQLTETFNAQDIVWAHFIDEKLLYQTSPAIKQRYMNERPFTAEIGPAAPGAIGRWLGWRIVSMYYDKRSVGIRELMQNADARQIFEQSGYKGQTE